MFASRNFISNRLALIALLGALTTIMLGGCAEQAPAGIETAKPASSIVTDAADQRHEVVLSVPGMNCPMCPVTVRRALSAVDGVFEAEADLEGRQARAVFDPAKTDLDALIAAVKISGFRATRHDPHE